jgi:hypothetical protein
MKRTWAGEALVQERWQAATRCASLCGFYPNAAAPFSTLNATSSYITLRKLEAMMYDALILIMGLAMFAAFLAYAAACEKM